MSDRGQTSFSNELGQCQPQGDVHRNSQRIFGNDQIDAKLLYKEIKLRLEVILDVFIWTALLQDYDGACRNSLH